MTSSLTKYRIATESLPYFLKEPTATLPERNRVLLLQTSPDFYSELIELLKTQPFQAREATPLLVRVSKLALSMADSMIALESNRASRALDLCCDLTQAFSTLSLEEKQAPSDIHFLCQSTPKDFENAFSYLTAPLHTIIETAPALFSEDTLFSLPRKTSVFFTSQFLGSTPQNTKKSVPQGASSCITSCSLNGEQFILKATEESFNDDPGELEIIAIQARQLKTEACVYMAFANNPLFPSLEAYSERKLWLEAVHQDLFTFLANLLEEKKTPPPQQLTSFFRQIAAALNALHKTKIVHEDVKAENILLTKENEAKLCDFGNAAQDGSTKNVREATPFYACPSKFYLTDHHKTLGSSYPMSTSNDCWSFGVLMYECISGELPFYNEKLIDSLTKKINASIIERITNPKASHSEDPTDVELAAEALIKDWNVTSMRSLRNESLKRSLTNKALCLSTKQLLSRYLASLAKGNSPEILFSNTKIPMKRTMQERDPLWFFKSIIIRCLNPHDPRPITMHEILAILANPPKNYESKV